VGINLHRRRSVIVHKDAVGELVSKTQIVNSPLAVAEAVAVGDESSALDSPWRTSLGMTLQEWLA
jgi:hypothetical protein